MRKKAAVVSKGWLGDSIACTAAATSLYEKGFDVTFYTRWQQLHSILMNDRRYKTIIYGNCLSYKISRPLLPQQFDLVVREPNGWSYEEPFTSQIRRMANCIPHPEYQLFLNEKQLNSIQQNSLSIAVAKDIYKRSYGRDIDMLIRELETVAEIVWVGLDSNLSSKHGIRTDLSDTAIKIKKSSLFFGPESGLLWLAAGLGTTCYYLTEHIEVMTPRIARGNPRLCLGTCNHFKNKGHVALKPYCSNEEILERIKAFFISQSQNF